MNRRRIDDDDDVRTPFPGPNATPPKQYKFTQEEMRVLRECNRDSFYQRCVPIGALLGFSTYYGVKNGHLRPNPRFGATPKVMMAVILGYFIGKFSYQAKCAEKLMQLPNSQIGEMLRQKRRGSPRDSLEAGLGPTMSLTPFTGMSTLDNYSELNPTNSLDIDTTRPENEGLDDSHRPSVDNPIYEEDMPPVQKHTTSYEELRKKNREEFQQRRVGNFRDTSRIPQSPAAPSGSYSEPDADRVPTTPRNKYGDSWG